ncbi:MAG: hypothetical protein Q9167_001107 [Letrouitia subvulpina]
MSTTEDDSDFRALNAAASSSEFAAHQLKQTTKTISPPIESLSKRSSTFTPIKAEQVELTERDALEHQALASIPEARRECSIDKGQPKSLILPSQIFSARLPYQVSSEKNAHGQAPYHQHSNSQVKRQPSKISVNTVKGQLSQSESSLYQSSGPIEHDIPVTTDVRRSNQPTKSDNVSKLAARTFQKSPPSSDKKRGRPPGSKNKEPRKPRNDNRLESPIEAKQERVKNLAISNAMKNIWAQRKMEGARTGDDIRRQKVDKQGSTFRQSSMAQSILQPRDHSNRQRYQSPKPRVPYNANEKRYGQENTNGQSSALLASWKSNDQRLTEFFRAVVYPKLVSSKLHYLNQFSESTLTSICRIVANDTFTPKFAAYLKETGYTLDDRQAKLIKRYINESFASKVKLLASQGDLGQFSQHNGREVSGKNLDKVRSLEQLTGTENYVDLGTQIPSSRWSSGPIPKTVEVKRKAYQGACLRCRIKKTKCVATSDKCSQCVKFGKTCSLEGLAAKTAAAQNKERQGLAKKDRVAEVNGSKALESTHPSNDTNYSTSQDSLSNLSNSRLVSTVSAPSKEELWNSYGNPNFDIPTSQPSGAAINQLHETRSSVIEVDWSTVLSDDWPHIENLSPPQLTSPRRKTLERHSKAPTAFNPALELALVGAAMGSQSFNRPYKHPRRGHVEFTRDECAALLSILDKIDGHQRRQISACLYDIRRELSARLSNYPQSVLRQRKKKSIKAFLKDLALANVCFDRPSSFYEVQTPNLKVSSNDAKTIGSLLRQRELALSSSKLMSSNHHVLPYRRNIDLHGELALRVAEDIRPWRSWNGACGDVVACAWAPDSMTYAAGAAAHTDELDLQYNRGNNLLFGELEANTIRELPDHHIPRPRPNTISSGPNANEDTYNACDPVIYTSVTAIQFSPQGGRFYTASLDETVKIWNLTNGDSGPRCFCTIPHPAEVTSLEVSNCHAGYFATASKTVEGAIRAYYPVDIASISKLGYSEFSSDRSTRHKDLGIYPECIRWGLTPRTQNYLLAGFQQWNEHEYSATRQGHLCVWDLGTGQSLRISPSSSSVFSAAFHPLDDLFAAAGASSGLTSYRKTRSVVRLYDICNTNSYQVEFESPSLDIQDVTFHPSNLNYIAAGYTDGITYVWDRRNPDDILHHLEHGDPLQPLPHDLPREEVDAGVMLSLWGMGGSRFYTGSSDGVVKAWDINRAPEDVWIKDVAQLPAGVQSGALSKDGVNMIVGDAIGGVHIFSAAPCETGTGSDDDEDGATLPIRFIHAEEPKAFDDNPGREGIEAAELLLKANKVCVTERFGVVDGPYFPSLYSDDLAPKTGFKEILLKERRQEFNLRNHANKRQDPDAMSPATSDPARRPYLPTPVTAPPHLHSISGHEVIDLETWVSPHSGRHRKRPWRSVEDSDRHIDASKVIDLTISDDEDASVPPKSKKLRTGQDGLSSPGWLMTEVSSDATVEKISAFENVSMEGGPENGLVNDEDENLLRDMKNIDISREEWVAEDFWWPAGC